MATIRAYTTIEQSKKLAEILPLESADYYHATDAGVVITTPYITYCGEERCVTAYKGAVPCWSLAALLSVLPMITKDKENANPFIAKTPNNEYYVVYATLTKEIDSSAIYDNPVDACVNMIEELNELKML